MLLYVLLLLHCLPLLLLYQPGRHLWHQACSDLLAPLVVSGATLSMHIYVWNRHHAH